MAKHSPNRVRIIAGAHRGRRLIFPDLPGLRPTGDRIRETLFNWLQPVIENARCLDLFAGSGALGIEAASRGAGDVVLLDQSSQVIRQLEEDKRLLALNQVTVVQADALQWLERNAQPFDLIFLDPPFAQQLLPKVCEMLEQGGWLKQNGLVYLEDQAGRAFDFLPDGWQMVKEQHAGQVRFGLARK